MTREPDLKRRPWPIALVAVLGCGLLFTVAYARVRAMAPSATPSPPIGPDRIAHDPVPSPAYALPDAERVASLQRTVDQLGARTPPLPPPRPGDWRARFDEPGQRFAAYLASGPNRPTPAQHTIYVQPLGPATPDQERVIGLAAEFLGRYFHLPVKIRPTLPLGVVPLQAFRRGADGALQMHTGAVLHKVLAPRIPPDAAAYLALTAIDLYPQADWNFVFGEASLTERVGVWSLARFGDPTRGDEGFQRVLVRTLKVASHETGHMFGIQHCTAHACNMNGSNSLPETDHAPLAPCPQCLAKICWLTGMDPGDWSRGLVDFAAGHPLGDEEERFRAALARLGQPVDMR